MGVLPTRLVPTTDTPAVGKILLKIGFRIAAGVQYDRSYILKFDKAVVSMQADCSVALLAQRRAVRGAPLLQEAVPGCVRSVFQCIAAMPGDMLHMCCCAAHVLNKPCSET
jgi:hypothetical protein